MSAVGTGVIHYLDNVVFICSRIGDDFQIVCYSTQTIAVLNEMTGFGGNSLALFS